MRVGIVLASMSLVHGVLVSNPGVQLGPALAEAWSTRHGQQAEPTECFCLLVSVIRWGPKSHSMHPKKHFSLKAMLGSDAKTPMETVDFSVHSALPEFGLQPQAVMNISPVDACSFNPSSHN